MTFRLTLLPLPAAAASVLPGDRQAAADIIGARLPTAWPQDDLLDVLPMQAALRADEQRFGVWLMIDRMTGTVIGDIGFMGPPADGLVELGFSVIPDRRRRGYASEAAKAIVDWALHEPGVRGVVARCEAGNVPSIGVLERVGFERTGKPDGIIRWRHGPVSQAARLV